MNSCKNNLRFGVSAANFFIALCCLFAFATTSVARAGETPAHPNVEPVDRVRPANAYMLGQEDIKEFPKYEKIWKEIFQLR